MSGNPNPSPATRFKPGSEWRGNAKGPKTGNPHKSTILRASRQVRPLDEVLADANNWRGTHSELLESVMRDEQHPIDTRLACANSPMRAGIGGDKPKSSADMKRLTTMERELFLALAYKLTDGAQAWKIDDYPMPEPRRSQEVQDILDYIAADGVEPDDDTATELKWTPKTGPVA